MRVLVTGGAGYIGSVLVEMLLKRGHMVRVLDDFSVGSAEALGATGIERYDIIDGTRENGDAIMGADIRDAGDHPEWFEGVDAVAHLAGFSNDPMADASPALNESINVDGTRAVALAATRANIATFTFGSSASVYDHGEHGLPAYYSEESPTAPIGGYSQSKVAAEAALLNLAMMNPWFKPVIFRQATVFGQSPRMRYDLMVNTMSRDATKKGVVYVHGREQTWRPLIEVHALAMLHCVALEGHHGPSVVNVANGNYTVEDVAKVVAHETGARLEYVDMPTGRRVRNYRMSLYRQALMFGPAAELNLIGESVRRMVLAVPKDAYDVRFENLALMRERGALA